jgi:glycosyltransferase involved in cell wall biosynthesis
VIQLYGRFDGWWSHSVVSRGIVAGLLANGVRGIRIWNVAGRFDAPAQYEDLDRRAVVGYDAEAPIGFYVGGYAPMATQWLSGHAVRGALLIAESETLPADWGQSAGALTRLFVPSHWCKAAFEGVHVPNGRISVLPHGVDPAFGVRRVVEPPDPDATQPVRLLHVAGAASFLDRKGTPQLLEAFTRVALSPGAPPMTLTLRTPMDDGLPIHRLLEKLSPAAARELIYLDGTPAEPPHAMAQLICRHHAVIQPSRAEAFGLIPCEARALGVPVVLTACAGHAEHFESDDGLVKSFESIPIVVNGIPIGGRAPKVSVDAVVRALRVLPAKLPAMTKAARERAAAGYAKHNSWEQRTKLLADWLTYQQRRVRRAGRGGIQLGGVE